MNIPYKIDSSQIKVLLRVDEAVQRATIATRKALDILGANKRREGIWNALQNPLITQRIKVKRPSYSIRQAEMYLNQSDIVNRAIIKLNHFSQNI